MFDCWCNSRQAMDVSIFAIRFYIVLGRRHRHLLTKLSKAVAVLIRGGVQRLTWPARVVALAVGGSASWAKVLLVSIEIESGAGWRRKKEEWKRKNIIREGETHNQRFTEPFQMQCRFPSVTQSTNSHVCLHTAACSRKVHQHVLLFFRSQF